MKKIITFIIILSFSSCCYSPYKKVRNIKTPTFKTIKKSMRNSEKHQPRYE